MSSSCLSEKSLNTPAGSGTAETSAPSALHCRLREATRAPHHTLDHHPLLAPLLDPRLSVAEYGNALAALYGAYAPAEAWILAFLERHPGLFDYRSRRKLPALEADLAALGRSAPDTRADVVAESNIGSLIGILYTLEGSTLGGQVIASKLMRLGGAELPLRFFGGYGEASRQRWEEFLRFADTACPPGEYEAAASAAVALFGAFKNHLDRAAAQPMRG